MGILRHMPKDQASTDVFAYAPLHRLEIWAPDQETDEETVILWFNAIIVLIMN